MSKILTVYLDQQLVGYFQQDIHGRNSFTYDQAYLDLNQAMPISQIMPLQSEKFDHKVCHAFFAGILPEDSQRRLIARYLGISANNDFSFLEKIGGECAGAITILPIDTQPKIQDYQYRELPPAVLTAIIEELQSLIADRATAISKSF